LQKIPAAPPKECNELYSAAPPFLHKPGMPVRQQQFCTTAFALPKIWKPVLCSVDTAACARIELA
jgi:hypothetical protein